eukprot:TRINITY_DN61530_c0_g1_i1.p1 TRINITY_DN61530_c0_g1~~TRINITY_DN61530_c0_g1_i1.p1  ORF type:complete len:620 (-),score=16.58 TRINITY_DN61530_c0_g1_i1:121-1980(-)
MHARDRDRSCGIGQQLSASRLLPVLAAVMVIIGISAFAVTSRPTGPSLHQLSHHRPIHISLSSQPTSEDCVRVYPPREIEASGNGGSVTRLDYDSECMLHKQKNSVINATYAKYLLISKLLKNNTNVFLFSLPGMMFGDPLDYLTHDSDIEVRSLSCSRTFVGKPHYEFEDGRRIMDLYNGYWHLEYATSVGRALWGCGTAWFFVEAGFDPRVFYLRASKSSLFWIDEVLNYLEYEIQRPAEDFSETHMFNTLLTRRLDKYMLVRKFPVGMYVSDTCAMTADDTPDGVVGRLHGQWISQERRDQYNHKFRPRSTPLLGAPGLTVPQVGCTADDGLCLMLQRLALKHPDLKEPAVGLVVIKGKYAEANPLAAKMPRANLPEHTLCCCLDTDGCQACTTLGMVPWPTREEITVATLPPQSIRELFNMYKYHLAMQMILRGFAVFSYDLDILFLRDPWEHFTDERFDIWVSSDAHVGSWTTTEHTYDLFSYIRTSVNAGLWYLRPTEHGKSLIYRISRQMNATYDQNGRVATYFFEQAQFATVLFQTRCPEALYCATDVRWKILSPTLFVPSKGGWQHTGDAGSMCNSVALHNNYGCPSWNLGRGKYEWLWDVAVNCGAIKE